MNIADLTPGIYLVTREGACATLIELFDAGEAGKYWHYLMENNAYTVSTEPDRAKDYVWLDKTSLGNQPAIVVRPKPDAVGVGRGATGLLRCSIGGRSTTS